MKKPLIIFGAIFFYTIGIKLAISDKIKWPVIKPIRKSFLFIDHKKESAKLTIVGLDGKPLYLLECYLNAYDHEDPNFNYSGDFECRLTPLNSMKFYFTLLTDKTNATADWQSRGRFLIEELAGKCADYPEYGKVRHFKLRGMDLTLNIKKFKIEPGSSVKNTPWERDRVKEVLLDVTVVPDPNASSEIAEPTKYLEPPYRHPNDPNDMSRNCDTVLLNTSTAK